MTDHFFNPYQFVPFGDRLDGDLADLGEMLAQAPQPSAHSAYLPDHWTGTIEVELRSVSPVVVLDPASERAVNDAGHCSYRSHDHVPATSMKGALRSLIEAATQSRVGVISPHRERLGFRPEPNEPGQQTQDRGARIASISGSCALLEVHPEMGWCPVPQRGFQSSAADDCCRLTVGNLNQALISRPNLFAHRPLAFRVIAAVVARVRNQPRNIELDRVVWMPGEPALTVGCATCHGPIDLEWPSDEAVAGDYPRVGGYRTVLDGVLLVGGRPGGGIRKHDERIVWGTPTQHQIDVERLVDVAATNIDAALIAGGRQLGDVRRDAAVAAVRGALAGEPYSGPAALEQLVPRADEWYFAELDGAGVQRLKPVLIARSLFERAPIDFLPSSHAPARNHGQLSPADRLFGWTPDKDAEGQPVAGRVRCDEATVVERGPHEVPDGGIPLLVLSSPKPTQTRFYLGERSDQDRYVKPLASRQTRRQAGYRTTGIARRRYLRGWKVYPHHRDKAGLEWTSPDAPFRNDGALDEQSRTLTSWIPAESTIRWTLDVRNVSTTELAILLAALGVGSDGALRAGWHLRVGYAKPLGFGSLQVARLDVRVICGADIRDDLRSWSPERASGHHRTALRREALREVMRVATPIFEAPTWRAVERVAAGIGSLDAPVEQPWAVGGDGRSYEWFVANSQIARGAVRRGHTLPDLAAQNVDPLPVLRA